MKTNSQVYLLTICFVVALGGFLFGFDTGVVSGLTDLVAAQYDLSPFQKGWFTSSALVGCIIGAASAGFLADFYGRRKVLFLTGILFLIAAVGCAYPYNWTLFIVVRILGGAGIGVASMVVPLYIAEIAPPAIRGRLGAFFQMAVVLGMASSYFSNALINMIPGVCPEWFSQHDALKFIFVDEKWRAMFLAGSVPAVLYTLLLFFVPESPRWQTIHSQEDKAHATLVKLIGPEDAARELEEISAASRQEKGTFAELFQGRLRFGIMIAVLLMFFSQVTGINVIMYYGPEVFKEARFSEEFSYWLQAIIGTTNIGFTLLAIWKIDQWGRKTLLKIGTAALLVTLAAITVFFFVKSHWGVSEQAIWLLPILMILFVGAFAMSWGPVPWVVVSEIFPAKIRGRAASIGTMSIWTSCFLVIQTFPILKELRPEICFGIYTVCMVLAMIFVWRYLPETRGKTLEEIEKELYDK